MDEAISYEYKVQTSAEPPSAEGLDELARKGWRLVSVTLGTAGGEGSGQYLAYLERPVAAGTQPRARKAFPKLLSGTRWRRRNEA